MKKTIEVCALFFFVGCAAGVTPHETDDKRNLAEYENGLAIATAPQQAIDTTSSMPQEVEVEMTATESQEGTRVAIQTLEIPVLIPTSRKAVRVEIDNSVLSGNFTSTCGFKAEVRTVGAETWTPLAPPDHTQPIYWTTLTVDRQLGAFSGTWRAFDGSERRTSTHVGIQLPRSIDRTRDIEVRIVPLPIERLWSHIGDDTYHRTLEISPVDADLPLSNISIVSLANTPVPSATGLEQVYLVGSATGQFDDRVATLTVADGTESSLDRWSELRYEETAASEVTTRLVTRFRLVPSLVGQVVEISDEGALRKEIDGVSVRHLPEQVQRRIAYLSHALQAGALTGVFEANRAVWSGDSRECAIVGMATFVLAPVIALAVVAVEAGGVVAAAAFLFKGVAQAVGLALYSIASYLWAGAIFADCTEDIVHGLTIRIGNDDIGFDADPYAL